MKGHVCVCRQGHLFLVDTWLGEDTTLEELVEKADSKGCPCGETSYLPLGYEQLWNEDGSCKLEFRGSETVKWLEPLPGAVNRHGKPIQAFEFHERELLKLNVWDWRFPVRVQRAS